MTNQQHPITPPPDLVKQWYQEADNQLPITFIATQAARWGADQELEACCEWAEGWKEECGYSLRAARRPKPPTLSEQALDDVSNLEDYNFGPVVQKRLDRILRAPEAES